jgi:hypothetical protein
MRRYIFGGEGWQPIYCLWSHMWRLQNILVRNYYHEYMLHSKLIIPCLIHILFTPSMSSLICTSSWFHSDVLGVVRHINELYEQVASTPSVESTSTPKESFSLCSVRFNLERIVYNQLADQEWEKYKRDISLRYKFRWNNKYVIFYVIVENYVKFHRIHFYNSYLTQNQYNLFTPTIVLVFGFYAFSFINLDTWRSTTWLC